MRTYGTVSLTFWSGATGRRLRARGSDVLLSALYLMTCPSSNMIGLFYLPMALLAHETGLAIESLRAALLALAEEGFAQYDEEEEHVWVLEMAKYQIGSALKPEDKRCSGAVAESQKMRKSKFYPAFWARYRSDFHLPELEGADPLEAPCKPLGSQEQDKSKNRDSTKNRSKTDNSPVNDDEIAPIAAGFETSDTRESQEEILSRQGVPAKRNVATSQKAESLLAEYNNGPAKQLAEKFPAIPPKSDEGQRVIGRLEALLRKDKDVEGHLRFIISKLATDPFYQGVGSQKGHVWTIGFLSAQDPTRLARCADVAKSKKTSKAVRTQVTPNHLATANSDGLAQLRSKRAKEKLEGIHDES